MHELLAQRKKLTLQQKLKQYQAGCIFAEELAWQQLRASRIRMHAAYTARELHTLVGTLQRS